MLFNQKQTKITLDATAGRLPGRNGQHVVSCGSVRGVGATLSAAREQCAENLTELFRLVSRSATFARDDDGSLIVAIPCESGTAVYRVTSADKVSTYLTGGDPKEAIGRVSHYRPIG